MNKRYISVDEIIQLLGVSRTTAYAITKKPGCPVIRIGTKVLVDGEKLIPWLEAGNAAKKEGE